MRVGWVIAGVLAAFALAACAPQPVGLTCTAPAVRIGTACCVDADADGLCDPAYAAPTCEDGLQNQGEGGPDCGGPCPGYWYGGSCHPRPQPGEPCKASAVFSGACEKLCFGVEFDASKGACVRLERGCCDVESPFESLESCQAACGGPRGCDGDTDCPVGRRCVEGVCQAVLETCVDGIRNQDETTADCGGVCGGYIVGSSSGTGAFCVHDEPPQCAAAADCKLLFSKCDCLAVADDSPLENFTGGAASCGENRCKGWEARCVKGNCTAEPPVPPKPRVRLVRADLFNESRDSIYLGRIIIEFEASTPGHIDWLGKVFVYKDDNDPFAKSPQGAQLETGQIPHGTTLEKSFSIDGIAYRYDSGPRILRVEWYDERTRQYLFSMVETLTLEKNYLKQKNE